MIGIQHLVYPRVSVWSSLQNGALKGVLFRAAWSDPILELMQEVMLPAITFYVMNNCFARSTIQPLQYAKSFAGYLAAVHSRQEHAGNKKTLIPWLTKKVTFLAEEVLNNLIIVTFTV